MSVVIKKRLLLILFVLSGILILFFYTSRTTELPMAYTMIDLSADSGTDTVELAMNQAGIVPLSQNSKYRSYDYVINSYNVHINVNEDNT